MRLFSEAPARRGLFPCRFLLRAVRNISNSSSGIGTSTTFRPFSRRRTKKIDVPPPKATHGVPPSPEIRQHGDAEELLPSGAFVERALCKFVKRVLALA